MRFFSALVCCLLLTTAAFAQGDRGTVTGTVLDTASAAVPNAVVVAKHTETGAQFETVTTATGNYTLVQVPSGTYELSVESSGFNKHIQQGVRIQVAQTVRMDVTLQVGGTTQSVTVTGDAPLLKTENAEQSYNIATERINQLPLNFGARGPGGNIRNPYTFVNLVPGAKLTGQNDIRINGAPTGQYAVRIEGQEANNTNDASRADQVQPSVEALQEISVQTSNFSAEYGQIAGGLFNFTTKSGTNQVHGSAYEYWVHETLNAGIPFSDDGKGGHVVPRNRRHDFGASLGGPVVLPKLYNGRDRTFIFLNFERYLVRENTSGQFSTVPTDAFRSGDFGAALTGRNLITDPLGRPIVENSIFDPLTAQTVSGRVVRNPFPLNVIPQGRLDQVALKIQAMIPRAQRAGLINNWENLFQNRRTQAIGSFKVDHNFSSQTKASFYYNLFSTHHHSNPDALPVPISGGRFNRYWSQQYRLNINHSVTPTLLTNFGIGALRYYAPDRAVDGVLEYDAVAGIGLVGSAVTPSGFPRINGLSTGNYGGQAIGLGPANANGYFLSKPTALASATWVRNNHTYKAGAEFRIEAFWDRNVRGSQGIYNFSNLQTTQPSTDGQSLGGGSIGHAYASFLLGLVNSATVNAPQEPHLRKNSWSWFVQDNWKVTRKLTLDYGLRWDREEAAQEINHRVSMFGPNVVNPAAGGLKGGMLYEGNGPGRCNCNFTNTYQFGYSPRLGIAYQINSKTVLRAGWGLTYGKTANYQYITNAAILGTGWNQLVFSSPGYGDAAVVLRDGLRYTQAQLFDASLNPGIRPSPGQLDGPSYWFDPNGGRPPRINQWNISLQRELTKNLVIEAAYVGNRGVWFTANNLIDLNAITPERLRSFGLDINSATDRTLLTSRLDSTTAVSRGFRAPYAGYPLNTTVAQSLRPYPQFTNIPVQWAPLGNTWYDSLQMKGTKRYSYGLDFTAAFTWQKELALGAGSGAVNDVFNRKNQKSLASASQPFVFVIGLNYELPAMTSNKLLRKAIGGWTVSSILKYSSGLPIAVPASTNSLSSLLFRGTLMNRVPGEPLYLKDLNCGCIDPNKDFVFNPKAWADIPQGQWGFGAGFYNDFRYARRPDEQLSLGRVFHVGEGKTFQVRAEFFNAFNRTYLNNPDAANPLSTQNRNVQGVPTAGFGRINTATADTPPRNGQIVFRYQW